MSTRHRRDVASPRESHCNGGICRTGVTDGFVTNIFSIVSTPLSRRDYSTAMETYIHWCLYTYVVSCVCSVGETAISSYVNIVSFVLCYDEFIYGYFIIKVL